MIDGEGCAGDYVLVVNIGGDAYDAAGLGADGNKFHDRVVPHNLLVGARVALRGELEAGAEDAFIAPGDGGADCDTIHSWKSGDLADGFFVEIEDLIGRASVGNDWDVDSENIVGVETGVHGLQSEERLEEHAGAGEEHEAGGDL